MYGKAQGRFSKSLSFPYAGSPDEQKVHDFLARFQEAIAGYDPRRLEELAGSDLSLAIIPLAHLSIGVKGILLFGSEEQKRRYLPRAASGDGGSYTLTGTKTYITNGNYAGSFTVFAQLDPEKPGHMGAFIAAPG